MAQEWPSHRPGRGIIEKLLWELGFKVHAQQPRNLNELE